MENGNLFNESQSGQRQKPAQKNMNFKYLDCLIHSGAKEIVLDSDIILDDDEELMYLNGIEIDVDDIVIDGGGHIIDACEKTRIFICSCNSVWIKNITLKNGFTEGDGGAIYNDDGCNLTVSDTTFDENRADNRGGAIKNRGEADISKSIFNKNTAGTCGAIENNGMMNISDSRFTQSIATAEEGRAAAIFNDEGCSLSIFATIISECRNRDDSSTVYSGGGIYNNGELTVMESIFIQNRMESGSAIINYRGVMKIRKSEFSDNTTGLGGAIENYGEADISETTLSNNVSFRGSGAAISNKYKSKMTISKSVFKNNSAVYGRSSFGAAVYNDGEMDMNDCTFTANIANQGGAICNKRVLNISKSTFMENISKFGGGAIKMGVYAELNVIESEFSKNSADYGGAISGNGAEIIDSVFSSNRAKKYGGAIRCGENGVKLTNCTFKDNTPDDVSEYER